MALRVRTSTIEEEDKVIELGDPELSSDESTPTARKQIALHRLGSSANNTLQNKDTLERK